MSSTLLAHLARPPKGALQLSPIAAASARTINPYEPLQSHRLDDAAGCQEEPTSSSTSTAPMPLRTIPHLWSRTAFKDHNAPLIFQKPCTANISFPGPCYSYSYSHSHSRYSNTTRWQSPYRSFASQPLALKEASPSALSPLLPGEQQEQKQQQDQEREPARPPNDVEYFGPLSQQHKLLKRISIANTLVASAAAPAIVAFADNISLVSRYGLALSLVLFGVATTGALHWVASPYVHELRYTAATGQIDVRTTTLLGNSRWHSFSVDDVQPLPWNRPVATFAARDRFYYIDVYSFPDEHLLRRLTPDEADVPKGYKDKEDDDDD